MDNAVLNIKMAQARTRLMEAATALAKKKHPEALDALNAAMRERNPQVKVLRQMEATAGLLAALAGLPEPEVGEEGEGTEGAADEEPASEGKPKLARKSAKKPAKK